MKRNKGLQLSAVLAVMLIVSMGFMPAVSAKPEQLNEDNIIILSQTDKEKIVLFEDEDGSITYAISWVDETNNERVNFVFMDKNELKKHTKLKAKDFNDNILLASEISAAKQEFWHGSYAEVYGGITGGIYIYFAPVDAATIKDGGQDVGIALGIIIAWIDGPLLFADPVAAVVALAIIVTVQAVFWLESNDDGSLDVKIPYSNIVSILFGNIDLKIGSHWYEYDI